MNRHVALVLATFLACTPSSPPMAQKNLSLQARGLYLTANPLDAPPGSLTEATNAVIRRPGIVEPRRGQAPDATVPSSAYVDSMASFEGELIVHTSADALAKRDNDTTITAYSGTFTPPAGHPMRFVESGGSLYATTNEGLVRLDSPSGAWTPAGVPPGLEGNAAASGTTGWLDFGETVGYRLVWGKRDGDGQLMLGAPSGRILYTNADNVEVSITRTLGTTVTATTSSAHGRTTGDTIELVTTADATNFPLDTFTITVTGATTFTYAQAGANVSSTGSYMVGSSLRDVAITTPIPDGVTLNVDFLQVYRTVLTTTGGADPGEDMAQVTEYFPTADEVTSGTLTTTDVASFANGATGYFSPSMGIGIAGAKEQPPLVTDATVFNGYLFGVVQAFRQSLDIALLGIGGATGLTTFDGIRIIQDAASELYLGGLPADEGISSGGGWIFGRYTTGTAGQNIEDTVRSLVRVINLRSDIVSATYASSVSDLPGKALLTERAVGGDAIYVRAFRNALAWTPRLLLQLDGIPTRAAGVVTVDTFPVAGAPHRLIVGEQVVVTVGQADFPPGIKTVTTTPTAYTFTYTEAGANVVGAAMEFTTNTDDVTMIQEATGSDYAFSDLEEPDAWPPRFRFKVGGPNTILYRIIPQGNALLFFTSAGLFRLTGRTEDEFVLLPIDPTINLVGAKTAISMGNRAFALTNQGVMSITDLGVEKVSGPLDQLLLPYYAGTLTDLTAEAAFGLGYQTENEYTLFLQHPEAGTGDPPDRAYTYNTQTGAWVGPWEFSWSGINTGNEVRAAHVHAGDGRLYIAAGTRLTRERKARNLSDYQDDTGVGIPMDVATTVNTASNPGAYKQWVESTVLLEQPQPSSVELYFTTEIDGTEEGATIPTQGNAAVRSYIPTNKSRSARLTVGMRCNLPEEKMSILGVQTVANISSTRVGR